MVNMLSCGKLDGPTGREISLKASRTLRTMGPPNLHF